MRLTKKDKIKKLLTFQKHKVIMTDNEYKELKLGQLEDWEEKIEMPLIKFLEWQIESKLPYCIIEGKIKKVAHYLWQIGRNKIEVWDANFKKRYIFHFRDYGKTWALTKEELL